MLRRPSITHARLALYTALGYLLFGIVWIVASDRIVAWLVVDVGLLTRIQSIKGIVFVVLSALLVYGLLRFLGDDDQIQVPRAGTRHPRVRFQLLALSAAIAVPLIALCVFNAYRELDHEQRDATAEVRNLARVVAADDSRFLRDTSELVAAVARRPAVRALDGARCDAALVELAGVNPQLTNVLTLRPDGTIVCSARDVEKPWPSMADRDWLRHALAANHPIVSRPFLSRMFAETLIAVATAIRDDAGKPIGVVNMTFEPSWLRAPPHLELAGNAFVALVDGAGEIIVRRTADEARFSAADAASVMRTLGTSSDIVRLRGTDGVERFCAVSPIDGTDWRVVAGMPVDAMLASSRALVAQTLVLGALTLVAIAWAAFLLSRRIERPMRAIAQVAHAVTRGDRGARAPVVGSRETAEMATQLNALLDRLPAIAAELRASEERLVGILAAAREGVIIYGADGRVTFANDAIARILGSGGRDQLIGARLQELIPTELHDCVERRIDQRRNGRGATYEVRLEGTGREARWVSISATPLATSEGAFAGVLAFVADITSRKSDEARIARLGRLYTMLGQLNEAIVRISDAHTLFAVTCRIAIDEGGLRTAFVGLLDESAGTIVPIGAAGPTDGVIGATPIPLSPDHPGSRGSVATAIRSGEVQVANDMANDTRTQYAQASFDRLGIHSVAALPLRYDGRVIGALALYASEHAYFDDEMLLLLRRMGDDLSFALDSYARAVDRDRAEAEVRALNATLELRVSERTAQLSEAVRELESFSYSASHDLRAPLRAINGFARVLQDDHSKRLDGEGRDLLARIVTASTRMAHLIDDLLSLARVGRGGLELHPVALSSVFDAIVEHARPAVDATGGRLAVPAVMPVVRGDETLLSQLFSNLVNNALEYHRPGRPPHVDITWRDVGERVDITVRDDGIGIDPAHHERIFEVFRRLHSQDEHPGTGIGLAIVAKAVALLDGEIRVESKLGRGAAFIVTLRKPLEPATDFESNPDLAEEISPRATNTV